MSLQDIRQNVGSLGVWRANIDNILRVVEDQEELPRHDRGTGGGAMGR